MKRDWLQRIEKASTTLWERNRGLIICAVSLLIIFWHGPYLLSGNLISNEITDADYFFQVYEAIRRSIMDYHQFPWWNPWVGGGVPLFANPQAGVFSIQTVLVIIFGTVVGLKLSVIVYSLLGFWGMFLLLHQNIKTGVLMALLLAFCWIANGFFVSHLFEHYTFLSFLLIPLGIHLQLSIRKRYYTVLYGIFLGLLVLSSFHYAILQGFIILGVVGLYQIFHAALLQKDTSKLLRNLFIAGLIFGVLAGARILYTVQYVFDFPQLYQEPVNSIKLLILGLLTPGVNANVIDGSLISSTEMIYSKAEHSAYMGLAIFAAVTTIALSTGIRIFSNLKQRSLHLRGERTILLISLFFALIAILLIAKGASGSLDLPGLIKLIPGYSNMRVSSRWLVWFGMIAIVIIATFLAQSRSSMYRRLVASLVIVAVCELGIVGIWSARDQFTREPVLFRSNTAEFVMYENYSSSVDTEDKLSQFTHGEYTEVSGTAKTYGFESTLNNIGDLYGYEPLNMTLFDTKGRCGINKGCKLIHTNNAKLVYWSPNEIKIQRIGVGDIELNMAPSSYWTVNNSNPYREQKVISDGRLTIKDTSNHILLKVSPNIPRPLSAK